MDIGNSSKGRAIGLAFFAVWSFVFVVPAAVAQNVLADAVSVTPAAVGLGLDKEVQKAETLFKAGQAALAEGRDADARESFDATLDTFLQIRGDLVSDPRLQAAYKGFIDRILAAELAAGSERPLTPPPPPPVRRPTPEPQPEVQPPAAPESLLADLGAKIEEAKPTEAARESNQAVLGSEAIDLPIEMNDQVLGAIDLYTGRFNKWFSAALSRGLPHLPRIREILAQAGIPQDLAYVPIVESAFNPVALSSAKARGLWQFIPSTGKQYGLKQDFFIDERSDVEKATVAAAQYLKNLYALFGDWNLALAGYNAGEGNVQRAIKRAQTNDFWALAKTKSFRAETKNYVPLIHAAIMIAKSPESYGIDVQPTALTASDTVRVSGSYPIVTVARCANADPAEIKRLNPELRRSMTPSSAFDLEVPNGSGSQVTACLAGEKAMNFTRHIVRKRDTLSSISNMFGVAAVDIARANGLTVKSKLTPGTELAIPRPTVAPRKVMVASRVSPSRPGIAYRIRPGDTLSSVATRYNTTVEALKALNGLTSTHLSIGQILHLSVGGSNETSPE